MDYTTDTDMGLRGEPLHLLSGPPASPRLSPEEYADLLLNIDQQAGLETMLDPRRRGIDPATAVRTAVFQEVRDQLKSGQLRGEDGLGELGSWWSKATKFVGSAIRTVASVPKKIAQVVVKQETQKFDKAITALPEGKGKEWLAKTQDVVQADAEKRVEKVFKVIDKIVTFPLRATVELALKAFNGPVSEAFVYTLIPDGAPVLANAVVADKRASQLQVLKVITDAAVFEPGYLLKHIRNAVVKHRGKTPEQIVSDLSAGRLNGLGQLGLDPATVAAAIAALGATIPAVIAVFKKDKLPAQTDFPQQVTPSQVNPNALQPGQDGASFASGLSPTVKTALMIGGGAAVLGIGYKLMSGKRR